MNGHLVAIEILVESFYVMPVSTSGNLEVSLMLQRRFLMFAMRCS